MSRPFHSHRFASREPAHRRNGKIRAHEIRVLGENKEPLGVMRLSDALRLAQQRGLDLVEIAPNATPPVCRIVNYGKLMYEEAKNHKEARGAGSRMKEVQISAGIDPHDFGIKLSQAIEFLCDDLRVRVKLRYRGRQKLHKEIGVEVVNRFVKEAASYGQPDAPPKMLGDRDLNVTLTPLPRHKRAKDPRQTEPAHAPAVPQAPPAQPAGA